MRAMAQELPEYVGHVTGTCDVDSRWYSFFKNRFWIGNHPPRHIHVLRDRKLIAKVELDSDLTVMEGQINRRIRES